MEDTEPGSPFKLTSSVNKDDLDHKSNDKLSKRVCENSNSDENDNDNDTDEHDKISPVKLNESEESLKTHGEEAKVAVLLESPIEVPTSEVDLNQEQTTQEQSVPSFSTE